MKNSIGSRHLTTVVELSTLFAKDDSERANIAASEIIMNRFRADTAALFYTRSEDSGTVYRFCMAGSDFPITLPETRWKESLGEAAIDSLVARFGPWTLPGFDKALDYWISVKLYSFADAAGYMLLGRSGTEWDMTEEDSLLFITEMLTPIAESRIEKGRAKNEKMKAEALLSEKEKRLRALFEGSPDFIYISDPDDVITSVNAAGVRLLGYTAPDELIGKPFSSLTLNQGDRELFLRRIREKGQDADYEIVLTKKDGTRLFCLESAQSVRNEFGKILEIQGIVKDISDRIRNEKELWKTNLELANSNMKLQQTHALMVQHEKLASIGQLAAGIAHEINNPLAFLVSNEKTVRNYFEKIRAAWEKRFGNDTEFAEIFSDLEEIFHESSDGFSRIMRIVGDLKNFARVERAEGFDLYDVNSGIESTLVVARNEIRYAAVLKKKLAEIPQIQARGNEINQVILNILVNAAQAIKEEKKPDLGVIEIRTEPADDFIRITIRDNGPGITDEVKAKIFDPFFTTKEPGKGTGLGLSISYDIIVAKHGGKLSVKSSPGEGAAFIIELPVAGPGS